jgi:O-antigen ligase
VNSGTRTNLFFKTLQIPVKVVNLFHQLLIKIFPPSPNLQRTDNLYVETLGLAGLFLFLLNINLSGSLHENGETMLIVAFLLAVTKWGRILVRQPLFWLMIAFAVALVISTLIGMENLPESRHKSEAKRMARLCLFVPLAWWIGSNIVSVKNAFLVVCAGFIIASLSWMLDWNILSSLFEGERVQASFTGLGPLHFAAWFGFLFIGVGILGRELLPAWLTKGKMVFIGYLCLCCIAVYLLIAVYVSQGRTTWIAVIFTLPLGLAINFFTACREKSFSFKKMAFPAAAFLLLVFLAVSQFEIIKNRFLFLDENSTITHTISGQFDQIEETPLGQRVLMHKWAIETESFIKFFGWGPRALQAIGRNEVLKEELQWEVPQNHLHSDLLATLFRMGIFGFSVFFGIFFFLVRGVYLGYRNNYIPNTFYAFFMMTILYAIIIGLTNVTFRINAFLPVWSGLIFATILNSHKNEKRADMSSTEASSKKLDNR